MSMIEEAEPEDIMYAALTMTRLQAARYFECDVITMYGILPETMIKRIRKQDQERNRIIKDIEKRKTRTLAKHGPTAEDIDKFRKVKIVRNYIRSMDNG